MKYKWDGTDPHKLFDFKVALYGREESVLNSHNFSETCEDEFDEEEKEILLDLCSKGMIYGEVLSEENEKIYYSGTVLYIQYLANQINNEKN